MLFSGAFSKTKTHGDSVCTTPKGFPKTTYLNHSDSLSVCALQHFKQLVFCLLSLYLVYKERYMWGGGVAHTPRGCTYVCTGAHIYACLWRS